MRRSEGDAGAQAGSPADAAAAAGPRRGSGKLPTLRELGERAARSAQAHFFAEAGEQNDDVFLEALRQCPSGSVRFLRLFMPLSFVICALESGVFLAFVVAQRGAQLDADKERAPLEPWLELWAVAHAALQGMQLPVRAVLLLSLRLGGRPGEVPDRVASVLSSAAWRAKRCAGQALNFWLAVGAVLAATARASSCCHSFQVLLAAALLSFAARVALMASAFSVLVEAELGGAPDGGSSADRLPASAETIAALPTVHFCGEGSCAVCLCEFDHQEVVKELPCRHLFHTACIDTWLSRRGRCPLCMATIPPATHAKRE